MTIRHMKIFVTVYRCKSITQAAKQLHLAQPSISLAIKELEDYYGIRLFDRISRKIFATETGRIFFDYAAHIVSLFDELEQGIKNWDSISTLRIGSSITIGSFYLPNFVSSFNAVYPNIKVHAVICNTKQLEENILENKIDIALIEGSASYPQIVQIPFMDDAMALIAGPGHPICRLGAIRLEALSDYDFILREKGSAGRDFFDSLTRAHDIEIHPIWESASNQAIINAVSANLGLSVLPHLLVRADIEAGRLIPVEIQDISLKRKFSVIYHKNKYLGKSAEAFIKICQGQKESLPIQAL